MQCRELCCRAAQQRYTSSPPWRLAAFLPFWSSFFTNAWWQTAPDDSSPLQLSNDLRIASFCALYRLFHTRDWISIMDLGSLLPWGWFLSLSLFLSSVHAFLLQEIYSELLFLLHLMQRRWIETKFDLPLDKVQRGRSFLVISKELYVNEHFPIWEDGRIGIPPAKSLCVRVFFLEAFRVVARACLRRYIYSISVVEGERERHTQSYNSDSDH
jgi:hypothetical protein